MKYIGKYFSAERILTYNFRWLDRKENTKGISCKIRLNSSRFYSQLTIRFHSFLVVD